MSAFVLSKIDIDVLVQLALFGPMDARNWRPLPDAPDALGTMLWQQNYAWAGYPDRDPPLPEYHFEPLPFGITAVEGLRLCACYEYQTADDEGNWRRSPSRRVLLKLEGQLTGHLPGWNDAPWGWGPEHVQARLHRGGAPRWPIGRPAAEPPDSMVGEVEAAFSRAGVTLDRTTGYPGLAHEIVDPRLRSAQWELRVAGQPVPVLLVELYRDEETARKVWLAGRARIEASDRHNDYRIARTGRVVARYHGIRRSDVPPWIADSLTALGVPDERWTTADPPLAVVHGDVLACRVPLAVRHTTTEGQHRVVVARDAAGVADLCALVADDAVRERIRSVDLATHTVLFLVGTASIESLQEVDLIERAAPDGDGQFTELLVIAIGATPLTGTVLVVDPLPLEPDLTRVLHPSNLTGWVPDDE